MKTYLIPSLLVCYLALFTQTVVAEDKRVMVKLPQMMQEHMLSNMRAHLEAINSILASINADELDKAATIAEQELGMSALEKHSAKHMAQFYPEGMQQAGSAMHHAASQFARIVEEGDPANSYKALQNITNTCVGCHKAYRVH